MDGHAPQEPFQPPALTERDVLAAMRATPAEIVEAWNAHWPPGSTVYLAGLTHQLTTSGAAFETEAGVAVVEVEGGERPFPLSRMVPIGKPHQRQFEGLYYIQDTRSYDGDSMRWWRADGRGYTHDIREAGLYCRGEAESVCREGVHRMWSAEYIQSGDRIGHHVSSGRVDLQEAQAFMAAKEGSQ